MAKIKLSEKIELREAGRCPECFRYLGKNEKGLTVDWCSNCHVSYPDNLRNVAHLHATNPRHVDGSCKRPRKGDSQN